MLSLITSIFTRYALQLEIFKAIVISDTFIAPTQRESAKKVAKNSHSQTHHHVR
jgi:hypothetical protein